VSIRSKRFAPNKRIAQTPYGAIRRRTIVFAPPHRSSPLTKLTFLTDMVFPSELSVMRSIV
jgi:hypothetical protein